MVSARTFSTVVCIARCYTSSAMASLDAVSSRLRVTGRLSLRPEYSHFLDRVSRAEARLREKYVGIGIESAAGSAEASSREFPLRFTVAKKEGYVCDEICVSEEKTESFEAELDKRIEALLSVSSRSLDALTDGFLLKLWEPPTAHYKREIAVAAYAVQLASTVAKELQMELANRSAISKSDSSPVTVADFTVQAIVLGILSRYFPEDTFIAEESSVVLQSDPGAYAAVLRVVQNTISPDCTEEDVCAWIDRPSPPHAGKGRSWVLDPIDGTKGFIRGEQFCIALALLEEGIPVVGVLGCPNLPTNVGEGNIENGAPRGEGQILFASRGSGAYRRRLGDFLNSAQQIHCGTYAHAHETRTMGSVESAHSSSDTAADICKELGMTKPPLKVDSQAKYAILASGEAGVYLRLPKAGYQENIWDHAGGAVVVEEAGGRVTDHKGRPLDFSQGAKLPKSVTGIVVTSGAIHDEVVSAVMKHHE